MSALLMAVLLMAPAQKEAQAEDPAKKIKELQKERLETLEKLVEQAVSRFKGKRGSYEDVLEAQVQLLQARLDAAEMESERIEFYTRTIAVLTQLEKVARARVEAGSGTEFAVLKVKARRLEVEVQLERAKIKQAKEKKWPKPKAE